MKKSQTINGWYFHSLKKTFLIMRIIVFLLLAAFLQTHANNAYAQRTKLSVDYYKTAIEEVLDAIENQSELFFLYNEKLIDTQRKVTIRANNQNVETILNHLFEGTNIEYTIVDRKIVLAPDDISLALQQQRGISGNVTDHTGAPLPGVTVVIKGTTTGTITNADGSYSISNVPANATLVFSFVGMTTVEILIGNQTSVNVVLQEETFGIGEVVAIGYGTQRRENITGSVASAGSEKFEGEPVVSIAQALQGDISGVAIRQPGGQPKPNTEIIIRGYGTFSAAGNSPLVLVDGIPSSINNVNPNDIKSISVLKDAASAAIYGSRAANGVILIETKRGKEGVMEVVYSGFVGFNELADKPRFVDSWIYAQAYNEGLQNMGLGKSYSDEDIQKFMSGQFPDTHPNDNHYDMALDNRAYLTKHDLTLSGGNPTSRYLFSMGLLRNDGILQNNLYDSYKENLLNYYNQYSVRLNVDSDVTEKLRLAVNLSGKAGDDHGPASFTGDQTMERVITRVTRMSSALPARTSQGYYGRVDLGAPWADIDSKSHELTLDYDFLGNTDLEYKILPSLSVLGRAGYSLSHTSYRRFTAETQIDQTTWARPNRLTVNWNTRRELTFEGLLRYSKNFGNHSVNALTGYSQIENKYNFVTAYRDNFPTNELFELNVASSANQQNTGGASQWALVSYFGRVQYDFEGKYLFEANARYDGSSRFGSGKKFGLFPSFSAGWRISEEEFMKESMPWLHNLKLRGSWGELGNQRIGEYPYQAILSTGANAIFGSTVSPGIVLNTVNNFDIFWETTRIIDIGVDFSVLKGKLDVSVDYFDKTTRDILYNITTAGVLGMGSSPVNAGKVSNNGWDFALNYKNTIGDFSYGIAPNFAFVKNKVLSLAQVDKDIARGLFVGQPLNAIYGYIADGLYVDEQDVLTYFKQSFNPVPGDIKYKDISGPDGVPDGKVTAEHDRTVIGQRSPKYTYGAVLTAKYKSFDFSLTFDGAGGMLRYLENMAGRAFANKSNVQQWMWDNRWTKENPNPDAIYPRFFHHGGGRNEPYSWYSTFWARDASYLKIRSVQLGYNVPASVARNMRLKDIRLYLSGRNLYTFDNFFPGWDPELNVEVGEGVHYPMTRTYIFGLNVKF